MSRIRLAGVTIVGLLLTLQAVGAAELEPASPIAGQNSEVSADVEFTLTADWQIGDSYRIESTKERTDRRSGVVKGGQGWVTIDARVEEKTSEDYVIAWTNVDGGLDNYAQSAGAVSKEAAALSKEIEALMVDLSKNLRSEIVTADTGFPTGIRNGDEMLSHMNTFGEKLLSTLDSHPEMQAKLRSAMQQVMNPQVIEKLMLFDAYIVYGLMGRSYRGGQVDTYDIELPFPFGGPPIPAKLHVLLREYDDEAGLARITAQSIPDPVQMKKTMGEWMTRMAKSQGQPGPEPSQVPELFVQDTVEYVYDLKMGLPREVTSEKFITVAGGASVRIDRRTFRISPLP